MRSERYIRLTEKRGDVPEIKVPEYNCINHAKVDFVKYAIDNNIADFNPNYYGWIDFGYIKDPNKSIPKNGNVTFNVIKNNYVNFVYNNDVIDSDGDFVNTLVNPRDTITGPFWFGSKNKILEYHTLYHNRLSVLHQNGIADDDQAVMVNCYFNQNGIMKLWKNTLLSDKGWFTALLLFNDNYYQSTITLNEHTDIYIPNIELNKLSPLCDIMNRVGSDKGGGDWHNYTILYHYLFEKYRDVFTDVFELCSSSSSLKGWYDYFPHAYIYGAVSGTHNISEDGHINVYPIDQTNNDTLDSLAIELHDEEFDLIIDDGIHNYEKNITFLEKFISNLRDSGYYIVQSIDNNSINLFESYVINNHTKYKYMKIIKIPHFRNKVDNNILLIIK